MRRTLAIVLILAGCGDEHRFDPESPFEEGALGTWHPGLSVGEAGGCSTGIVAGLSQQLIDEVNCLRPNTLVDFRTQRARVGAVVFPFLQPGGRDGLHAALRQRGRDMQINSALRTLAQQFLLHRWWQQGRCNIRLAARPGRSRHESGLALDIEDNAGWRASLQANGFRWFGGDDPVHFDYVGAGTVDLSGLSVRAFQRLWNRNHREDLIDEDGLYGPQTEARLLRAPTDGFDIGACPAEPPPPEPDMGVIDAAPPPPPPRDARPPPPPRDAAPLPPPPMDQGPIDPPRPDAAEPVDARPLPDAARTADARPPRGDRDPVDPRSDAGPRTDAALVTGSDRARLTGGCRSAPGGGPSLWALLALVAVRRR